MKRIETMSNDEVLEVLNNTDCNDCKVKEYCKSAVTFSCCKTKGKWLSKEITLNPRIATINTYDEYRDAMGEKFNHCRGRICDDCKYSHSNSGFASCDEAFLLEMVEVEE